MKPKFLSSRSLLTLLATAAVLILAVLNVGQQREFAIPDDGVSWLQGERGVEARTVASGSPGDRGGIRPGDVLQGIAGEPIVEENQVARIQYELGLGAHAVYTVERDGAVVKTDVVFGLPEALRVRPYWEISGLICLLAGLFVLVRRSRMPQAFQFYWLCLVSFVLFGFHYTGKFDALDSAIFWLDLIALLLLPPMLFQFARAFPDAGTRLSLAKRVVPYIPGILMLAVWLSFVYRWVHFPGTPLAVRQMLDNAAELHFVAYLGLSAAVLMRTYMTRQTPELRQQMKWVAFGATAAALSYTLFQAIPRFWGVPPIVPPAVPILSLALIPIGFGYAMYRYRLMDVDILFKRGIKWTLATASVLALYATIVALVGELLPVNTFARVSATILAALLFAPIKDQFQVWLDRFFYRDRYDVRQTLVDFGRTLGSEVHLDRMLGPILDRLGRALLVERTAIFLEHPAESGRFQPALASGTRIPQSEELGFLRGREAQSFIFLENEVHGLNYFVPCRVKDRVIAYIGLGRMPNGSFLTSEDIKLLETVSDYLGIALENARLYSSLEREAVEYQNLKDFSENIVESIHVGVAVEDENGRIAGWNKALEEMTGSLRAAMIGKRIQEALPVEFVAALAADRNIYKRSWSGLTVNVSATPLVDKAGAARGRLIIIDDITDRVRLEDQLVQNEKLTSIGLLAAGVAHEVNTPLAVISSNSQMLRKQIQPEDPRSKLLEGIVKQTFRASEIVGSLLSFSRTRPTEFSEVDVHQVIRDTLSLVGHPLKSAGISVEESLVAESPLVFGNSGRLQQVFLNLFLNAKDAMSNGGRLSVRTHSVDSRIDIAVEDTGLGIRSEDIMRIYDPFFTTKTAGKGTGLGLSVSYGIVQEHGGSIAVESRPGEGTTFRLEFPLARKPVSV